MAAYYSDNSSLDSTDSSAFSDSESEPSDSSASSSSEETFQVRKILQTRLRKGVREYRIRWAGYNSSADSWEPEANIIDKTLIDAFHRSAQKKVFHVEDGFSPADKKQKKNKAGRSSRGRASEAKAKVSRPKTPNYNQAIQPAQEVHSCSLGEQCSFDDDKDDLHDYLDQEEIPVGMRVLAPGTMPTFEELHGDSPTWEQVTSGKEGLKWLVVVNHDKAILTEYK